MEFHEVPWDSMRFHGVSVNRSVPTETNRGLTSYIGDFSSLMAMAATSHRNLRTSVS
jgi:hypothetical protein